MVAVAHIPCGGKRGPIAPACPWVPGQQQPNAMCAASRLQSIVEGANLAAAPGKQRRGQSCVTSATMQMQRTAPPKQAAMDAQPLTDLIDVDKPYLRYSSLQVMGTTVRAFVERESQNKCEPYTPMAFAEICRHIANVGELACAAANPVKERHFYLAITGSFQLAVATAGAQQEAMCGGRASSAIEIEAKVTRFRKATANVDIQVYTPGSDSNSRQLYADMKVLYMVMPEEKFRGQFVRDPNNCYADMESVKSQGNTKHSPYEDPICVRDIKAPARNVRTARLVFEDLNMTPGHFPDVPALPATTVLANAMRLLSVGFGSQERPLQYTVVKAGMHYKRLPMLGETLVITCTDVDDSRHVKLHAVGEHDGKDVMLADVHLAVDGDDIMRAQHACTAPASKL